MAKGSFLGVKRGKLGDVVLYEVTNSKDKDKQGWRPYQPKVRNPQTDDQMVQRVKLAAVNNLYRDLKGIIRRSMEAKKYGDESRRAWLSKALGQQFEGPWIPKGSTLGCPIKGVPISVGSLAAVVAVATSHDSGVSFFLPVDHNAVATAVGDPDYLATIGHLSQVFILAGYQPGDQVTFVTGYVPMRASFTWVVKSFIIDASDITGLGDFFGKAGEDMNYSGSSIGDTDGTTIDLYVSFGTPVDALAVIVSRDGQTVGSHLRSTAYFEMNSAAAANWYSEGAYEFAKRSYLTTAAANTNWEQDPTRGATAQGETRARTNADTPAVITVDAWRNQGGYALVHDATNNIWRYVYCTDVRLTQYHKWMTNDKVTAAMWTGTAPSGAEPTDAVRMLSTGDATADDLAFDAWLVENGYNARFIYGNAQ